jgi:hypothetical protein
MPVTFPEAGATVEPKNEAGMSFFSFHDLIFMPDVLNGERIPRTVEPPRAFAFGRWGR